MGGWASNSKYSLLGGLRSSAQMISYELPMALAIVAPLLMLNTLNFREMVDGAGRFLRSGFIPRWTLFAGAVPAGLQLHHLPDCRRSPKPTACRSICRKRKANWSPASTPSTRRTMFAAFFTAEYANIVTVCCVATLLFLGGWHAALAGGVRLRLRADRSVRRSPALICFFHGYASATRRSGTSSRFPVFGVSVPRSRAVLFLVPMLQPVLIPLFWFAVEGRAS